jgi:hypothetical protein
MKKNLKLHSRDREKSARYHRKAGARARKRGTASWMDRKGADTEDMREEDDLSYDDVVEKTRPLAS